MLLRVISGQVGYVIEQICHCC